MRDYLWVGLGGALGSIGRFWLSGWAASRFGETFPWGTLLVNLSGSFVIGLLATLTAPEGRWWVTPSTRQFIMIGVLGGYTTFSSFSLQTLTLAQEGEWGRAGVYVLASVGLCLAAVWLGHLLGLDLSSPKGP
ncbi:MAG: fluoride efflux transporter CrcB [Verrucomicrobia bacterium]|nr:fluoride efflux transporter CrcB [Verrucomicrobiota bacterium]